MVILYVQQGFISSMPTRVLAKNLIKLHVHVPNSIVYKFTNKKAHPRTLLITKNLDAVFGYVTKT